MILEVKTLSPTISNLALFLFIHHMSKVKQTDKGEHDDVHSTDKKSYF